MAGESVRAVEIPDDCFVAHSFNVTPCPCGCGTFELVGLDEKGVARALILVGAHQLVLMAATATAYAQGMPFEVTEETRH